MIRKVLVLCALITVSYSITFDLLAPKINVANQQYNVGETRVVRETEFFQFVDHFNPSAIWSQKVLINDANFQFGGPFFIFLSGQATNNDEEYWLQYSNVASVAKQLGGVLYSFEQRYFGRSRPVPDLSVENLRFLTVEQILADYVENLETLRILSELVGSNKIILYGYGIGATYATWLRQANPHLVDGVLASSAQLYVQSNFYSFFIDVKATFLKNVDDECAEVLNNGFIELNEVTFIDHNGTRLQELFNLSDPLDTHDQLEVARFYAVVTSIFGRVVEFQRTEDIHNVCTTFKNSQYNTPLEKVAEFVRYGYDNNKIIMNYNITLEIFRNVSWTGVVAIQGARQNLYLSCTQHSWFKTFEKSEFEINAKQCSDVFDDWITSDTIVEVNNLINSRYAIRIDLENVYFTHGSNDPFRLTGITSDLNPSSPADVLPNVGKSFDLPIVNFNDSPEILAVKKRAAELIIKWIQN